MTVVCFGWFKVPSSINYHFSFFFRSQECETSKTYSVKRSTNRNTDQTQISNSRKNVEKPSGHLNTKVQTISARPSIHRVFELLVLPRPRSTDPRRFPAKSITKASSK